MFHVHFRGLCILLLLDGVFCEYLSSFGLQCCLSPMFLYSFSVWRIYPLLERDVTVPCCYCIVIYPPAGLLIFALYTQVHKHPILGLTALSLYNDFPSLFDLKSILSNISVATAAFFGLHEIPLRPLLFRVCVCVPKAEGSMCSFICIQPFYVF